VADGEARLGHALDGDGQDFPRGIEARLAEAGDDSAGVACAEMPCQGIEHSVPGDRDRDRGTGRDVARAERRGRRFKPQMPEAEPEQGGLRAIQDQRGDPRVRIPVDEQQLHCSATCLSAGHAEGAWGRRRATTGKRVTFGAPECRLPVTSQRNHAPGA
jgi:hypothetical protein